MELDRYLELFYYISQRTFSRIQMVAPSFKRLFIFPLVPEVFKCLNESAL